jgi:hypothetical protein
MKEQGRPTLTLRRKAEPEGQRAVTTVNRTVRVRAGSRVKRPWW